MILKSASVHNFRSILDSNTVTFESNLTALIGSIGAGKTSFMRMLTHLDPSLSSSFQELPNGTNVKNDYTNGDLKASEILQLEAQFETSPEEKVRMPDAFKTCDYISVRRYFDGHFTIKCPDGDELEENIANSLELSKEREEILNRLDENFHNMERRNQSVHQFTDAFNDALRSFSKSDFKDPKEVELAISSLFSSLSPVPKDGQFQNEIKRTNDDLVTLRNKIVHQSANDPVRLVLDMLPLPEYRTEVVDLSDKVAINDFIKDSKTNKTFYHIAIISGLKPSGVESIRNSSAADKASYLDSISKILSNRLNSYWNQEKYDFKISIDNDSLTFGVKDGTTGRQTSVLEGSDGFKWWTSFFLEMEAGSKNISRNRVLLLDNPATKLHDDGKGDVLRYLEKISTSDNLQVIYATHERALIDPWRTERIRIVEKGRDGTRISKVDSDSRSDFLDRIRRNIGSPARYSLYGAPRTIAFEGPSDMNIVSAFNELFERQSLEEYLHKDLYSINAINGINETPLFYKLFKSTTIDFLFVLDSGDKLERLKGNNYESEDMKADLLSRIVEISEITGKEVGDTEDLVDPRAYYEAFKLAYKDILPTLPSLTEINKEGENKKQVNRYEAYFKKTSTDFSKTLVSQKFFELLLRKSENEEIDKAIDESTNNFQALFKLVKNKFDSY